MKKGFRAIINCAENYGLAGGFAFFHYRNWYSFRGRYPWKAAHDLVFQLFTDRLKELARKAQFIVFGHTHHPEVALMDPSQNPSVESTIWLSTPARGEHALTW